MANFFVRIAGAAALDAGTYEAVEADQAATPQALLVILFARLAAYKGVLRTIAVCSLGWLLALGFIIVFGLLASPALSAQAGTPQLPPAARVYDGGQLFRDHCATCHGTRGKGDGPMSVALRRPPADLTKFATMNGGVFPSERLRRIIDGRDVPSHGDRSMPVWGVSLRTSRDGGGYDSVEARIDALVRYIQSLQERQGQ